MSNERFENLLKIWSKDYFSFGKTFSPKSSINWTEKSGNFKTNFFFTKRRCYYIILSLACSIAIRCYDAPNFEIFRWSSSLVYWNNSYLQTLFQIPYFTINFIEWSNLKKWGNRFLSHFSNIYHPTHQDLIRWEKNDIVVAVCRYQMALFSLAFMAQHFILDS